MSDLVQLNAETSAQCGSVLTRLQADSALRLYADDLTPTPATDPGTLTEATFSGYAAISLDGLWSAVEQEEDGLYATLSDEVQWEPPGSGSETLYLVGLEVGGAVRWLTRLASPWAASPTADPLRLRVRYRQWSASLLA